MSYNKRTWANGNVVGAVDLNRIENGIADIDVDEIRGWGVQNTQLFSETVTTATTPMGSGADLVYSSQITANTITVVFENVEYEVDKIDVFGNNGYGTMGAQGPDFTVYPFFILSSSETEASNQIYTETNGTYTVAVNATVVEVGTNSVPLSIVWAWLHFYVRME